MSEDILKKKIAEMKARPTMEKLDEVVEVLKECSLWMPCTAVTDEKDDEKVKKMIEEAGDDPESLVGKEYASEEGIRIVPKFIEGGEHLYLPVFSSTDEMIEDSETSEVETDIFEAILLAENCDQKLRGIVVNPFTQGFIMDGELIKVFDMKDEVVS